MQNRLPNETPGGWLGRLVGAVVSVAIMVALFFLGLTVFAAVAGLALVVFAVVAVRIWWLRRRFARQAGAQARHQKSADGVTIEGEYEERHK